MLKKIFSITKKNKKEDPRLQAIKIWSEYLDCSEKEFLTIFERIGLTNIDITEYNSDNSFEFTANNSDSYICQISPGNYDEFPKLNLQNTSKKITALYECTTHDSIDGIPVLTLINTNYLTDNFEISLSFYCNSNYIYIIKNDLKLQLHLNFPKQELANSCKEIISSNISLIVNILTHLNLKSSIYTNYNLIISTIGLPINLISSSIVELELFKLDINSKNQSIYTKISSYYLSTGKVTEYSNYCFDTMTSILVKSNNSWTYWSNNLVVSFDSQTNCKNISINDLTNDLKPKTLETIFIEKEALVSEYWKYLN